MRISSRKRRRPGFVLLMVVGILAIVAAAMAALANRSLSKVTQCNHAHDELAQRWLVSSLRKSVLSRGGEIFADSDATQIEQGRGQPFPNEITVEFEVDEYRLSAVLRDEQARLKIDRNSMFDTTLGIHEAALASTPPLRLRKAVARDSEDASLSSWGQLVDLGLLDRETSVYDALGPLSKTYTCWGNGKTTFNRASGDVVRTLLTPSIPPNEVEQLLVARNGYTGDLETLVQSLDIHRTKQLKILNKFTDESNCFSLWVIQSSAVSKTEHLFVRADGRISRSGALHFSW